MKTITIKNRHNETLYSHTCKNNTYKITLEKAVKENVCLDYAYLHELDLSNAYLPNARLHAARLINVNLSNAILCNSDLSNINLISAKLISAKLYNINLINSNLSDSDLFTSSLYNVNLNNSNIRLCNFNHSILNNVSIIKSNLFSTNFYGAELVNINLTESILNNTNFFSSYLKNVKLENIETSCDTLGLNLACPEEGSFIAYKKINNCLIKLEIPSDAKRSSATTFKCRCDKAKVLEILNLETNKPIKLTINNELNFTTYEVGKIVYADSFDENRWNECSHGIHFFMNKQEAIDYYY